jgi:DegV family protein with EDD domain
VRDITVITDSTSDMSRDICERHGITVVPLSVTLGGETFSDGTLTQTEFFARMNAAPELPKTSQPTPAAFREVYAEALASAREVVSVHISEKLSGTIESAREAAKEFGDRVHIFDSGNLSWGLGFQVLEAARAVANGSSMAEVLKSLETVRDRVQMIVEVDKLDNLQKGGRIGRVAGFLGGMLNFRVTFFVRDGEYFPLHRARGSEAVIKECLGWVAGQMEGHARGSFCVLNAFAGDRVDHIRRALEERYDVAEMYMQETGIVISTHTGTGFGIAFVPLD